MKSRSRPLPSYVTCSVLALKGTTGKRRMQYGTELTAALDDEGQCSGHADDSGGRTSSLTPPTAGQLPSAGTVDEAS